jgi:sec-independent protein translocase protein TatB
MLDIGWQELFFIGIIALIVVGPKDLPRVLRTVAHFVRKARGLAREFQGGVADMVREAELDEIKRKVDGSSRSIEKTIKDTVDPTGSLTADFDPTEFNRQLKERVESGPPSPPTETESASGGGADTEIASDGGAKTESARTPKTKSAPKTKSTPKPKSAPKPKTKPATKAQSKPKQPRAAGQTTG